MCPVLRLQEATVPLSRSSGAEPPRYSLESGQHREGAVVCSDVAHRVVQKQFRNKQVTLKFRAVAFVIKDKQQYVMLWNREGSLHFVWVLMCELCPRTAAQSACTEHPACAMHALAPCRNQDQCWILLSWKLPRSKQEEKLSGKGVPF